MTRRNQTLLIIGAGPKALAIHVRSKALRDLGYDSPHVVIVERWKVGANWAGESGFTDGSPPLVTSPERDVGFPYKSERGPHVDLAIARYSWHAFMVAERGFAALVDGNREPPTHARFAEYLSWVAQMSCANIIYAEVVRGGIRRDGCDWLVDYRPRATREKRRFETLRVGGVVVSGPGKPTRLVDGQDAHFSISDGETFWSSKIITDLKRIDKRLDWKLICFANRESYLPVAKNRKTSSGGAILGGGARYRKPAEGNTSGRQSGVFVQKSSSRVSTPLLISAFVRAWSGPPE